MCVGINKTGKAHNVELFDLAPAVSAEGMLAAFHGLPSLPGDNGDGLAPLCCQHLHQDEIGQLQAKFESQTRLIGGAMCMFRARAEPEASMLQKAGAPQTVQTMNRMRVGELVFANVILQSD